ncbi:MAG: hypothetical protein MJZ22_02860 [Candidatus Saccharibacteria bacterium]|nr:hypothetical protein [Candidatus Saccharibacteria bacterium]
MEETTENIETTTTTTESILNSVVSQLVEKLLSTDESAELKKIRKLLLLRSALETEVKATRIPLPQNITEIGGYYNLLADIEAKDANASSSLQKQVISSALGLPTNFAPNMTDAIITKILEDAVK